MITIHNLSKIYSNGVRALDHISLKIPAGMFGLLGPNGAGKSTLMRTLATLQAPDSGTAYVEDLEIGSNKMQVRKMLGYLPQEFGVYPGVSAQKLLEFLAQMKGVLNYKEQAEALLYKVNLHAHARTHVSTYSGGMKQRFGIAQALLGNPKLLIVDEPTAGLDPAERNRFHKILAEVGEEAVVILSTHIVEDIKNLCPQLAIMNKGKIISCGNTSEMIQSMQGKVWMKMTSSQDLPTISESYRVLSTALNQGRFIIYIFHPNDPGDGFLPKVPSLEDLYFYTIAVQEQNEAAD